MKKFSLEKCVPGQGNRTINEYSGNSETEAIQYFNSCGNTIHEPVQLDVDGYQKIGEVTYCVAEEFDSRETNYRKY
jgi:hypothetical protein